MTEWIHYYNPIWPTPRSVEIAKGIKAGMPEPASWRLAQYRFRADDGNESSAGATFLQAANTNHTITGGASTDTTFRIRFEIGQTNAAHDQSTPIQPRLEAKLNSGGTWAAVPSAGSGSYVEISASQLTDNAVCTNHGFTLTYTINSTVGYQEESAAAASSTTADNGGTRSMIYEWAVNTVASGLANNDVIYFRLTEVLGTLFTTYSYGDASDTNPITITVTTSVTDPVWDQDSFRVGNDDGSESAYNFKRAANVNWTQRTNSRFLIRFLVQETAGATASPTLALQLQYNKNAAGWNDVSGASSNVRAEASANLTEGGDTTQRIGAGTFLTNNNWVDDNDGLTAASGGFAGNDEAEAVFSIYVRDADVADDDSIQLRVIESPSTPLDTYTNTPTLTVTKQTETIKDSLTLTENFIRTGAYTRNLNDALTLTENLSRDAVYTRNLNDSLTLTDSIVKSITKLELIGRFIRRMFWR